MLKVKKYLFVNSINTNTRIPELANQLGVIFATDSKSASEITKDFYYPHRRATATSDSVAIGGYLIEKYYKWRQKLIACGLIFEDNHSIDGE